MRYWHWKPEVVAYKEAKVWGSFRKHLYSQAIGFSLDLRGRQGRGITPFSNPSHIHIASLRQSRDFMVYLPNSLDFVLYLRKDTNLTATENQSRDSRELLAESTNIGKCSTEGTEEVVYPHRCSP